MHKKLTGEVCCLQHNVLKGKWTDSFCLEYIVNLHIQHVIPCNLVEAITLNIVIDKHLFNLITIVVIVGPPEGELIQDGRAGQ